MLSVVERPSFPTTISPSKIVTLKECARKFEYNHIWRQETSEESVHLVAGGAFAKGLEVARRKYYEEGFSQIDAVAIGMAYCMASYGDHDDDPEFEQKPWLRTMGALEAYVDRFPFATDYVQPITFPGGKRGIEFSYAIPLPIAHPNTGDPILASGRCDMVGVYQDLILCTDEKTTKYLGDKWPHKWGMRGQLKSYVWAAREHSIPAAGALVRGVAFRTSGAYDFGEVILQFPRHEIDQWYEQFLRDVQRAVDMYKAGYFDYDYANACDYCEFNRTCRLPETNRMAWMKANGFQKSTWDSRVGDKLKVEIDESKRISDSDALVQYAKPTDPAYPWT